MTTLAELMAEATFPVYGIRPVHWSGPAYVGDVARTAGRITQVTLVYQHAEDLDSAICVSSIGAAPAVSGAGGAPTGSGEPTPGLDSDAALGAHLNAFVSRFDPAHMLKHNKPRKPAFRAKDFTVQEIVVTAGGANAAAHAMRHRKMPLELIRIPLRAGSSITDVGLAGWRAGVRDLTGLLERVDASFARELDRANQAAYPFAIEDPPPG